MSTEGLNNFAPQAAERHFDALVDRIKIILENVTTEECANYFIAAGYVKT